MITFIEVRKKEVFRSFFFFTSTNTSTATTKTNAREASITINASNAPTHSSARNHSIEYITSNASNTVPSYHLQIREKVCQKITYLKLSFSLPYCWQESYFLKLKDQNAVSVFHEEMLLSSFLKSSSFIGCL